VEIQLKKVINPIESSKSTKNRGRKQYTTTLISKKTIYKITIMEIKDYKIKYNRIEK
jgi:hypothetical protein